MPNKETNNKQNNSKHNRDNGILHDSKYDFTAKLLGTDTVLATVRSYHSYRNCCLKRNKKALIRDGMSASSN